MQKIETFLQSAKTAKALPKTTMPNQLYKSEKKTIRQIEKS